LPDLKVVRVISKGRIAAAHGRFNRIRQVAPPYVIRGSLDPPDSAFLQAASRSFSRFCKDHGRESLYFTMGHPFPSQNCPFGWGSGPHPINDSWPIRVHTLSHTISRYLYRFSRFCMAHDRDRQTDRPRYVLRP